MSAAGTTRYLLDGLSVIAQYAPDGQRQALYTQSLARIDEVLNVANDAGKFWYQADALGSVYGLTNQAGALVGSQGYDVFGAPMPAPSGPAGQPFGFTGREHELDSGLTYYRDRYMQAAFGRWTQADRLGDVEGPNLYGYVTGNPVRFADPRGQWTGTDDLVFLVGGAIAGLVGQVLSDIMMDRTSSWQDYVAAAVSGAVTGWLLLYTGPVIAGMAGGIVGNYVRQTLKQLTGAQCEFDWWSLIGDAIVGGASGFMAGRPIPGVTSGRNSMNAIFKQMVTKFKNGTAKTVSVTTALKMFYGRAADTAFFESVFFASGLGGDVGGLLGTVIQ